MAVSGFSVEDIEDLLLERGIPEEVSDNFRENCVTGAAFLKLTEGDLKELVPMIGVRTIVREIIQENREVKALKIVVLVLKYFPLSIFRSRLARWMQAQLLRIPAALIPLASLSPAVLARVLLQLATVKAAQPVNIVAIACLKALEK